MPLQTLSADATTDEILSVMERDGAVVIADLIDADTVARMTSEVMPYIDRTPMGKIRKTVLRDRW